MEAIEVKSYLEKSSKRAALLSLAGVLIIVGALIFSSFYLNRQIKESNRLKEEADKLSEAVSDKKAEAAALDQKIEEQKRQIVDTQNTLINITETLKKNDPKVAENVLAQVEKDPQSKAVIQDVKTAAPLITKSPTAPTKTNDLKTAQAKEREGFQSLLNGNYDQAIAAFQASENAYNSYHQVYELARFVRRNKEQFNDPANKKELFQKIVSDYSYGAPPDLLGQIKAIANQ